MAAMTRPWPVMQPLIERAPLRASSRGPLRHLWRPGKLEPGLYIFAYHSLYDERTAEPWERHYGRVLTRLEDFRTHLAYLRRHMQPTTLAEAATLFEGGRLDAPYFALTFDDGYVSVARVAVDACAEAGLRPTVFACADFAAGRTVYYRVLLSVLESEGRSRRVAELLSQAIPGDAFRGDDLLSETKARYTFGATEAAVLAAWREVHGEDLPTAHLTFADLNALLREGWTVANHTRSHPTLSALPEQSLDSEILGNQIELEAAGLRPLPWLAYPNGAAQHVGPAVGAWLDSHRELMGAHGNGGVNLEPSRTEWLRIPVGDEGLAQLRQRIDTSLAAAQWARALNDGAEK